MRWWPVVALAFLLVPAPAGMGQPPLPSLGPSLPEPVAAFAAVWTPEGAYFFGGDTDLRQSDDIVHWVPGSDPVVLPEKMPAPRWGQRAIWTGSEVYVFGGYDKALGHSVSDVLRYVPGGAAPAVVAHMPVLRDWTAVFWDPRPTADCVQGCAYIAGGGANGAHADIWRFDVASETFDAMAARLPSGRWGMGAGWDGARGYLVGGYDGHRTYDVILSYDPVADEVAQVAELPWPAVDSAVAWHDGALYIAGGHVSDEPYAYATLMRWTPGDAALGSCLPLPRPTQKGALVSTGDELWLVGGYDDLPGGRRFATDAMRPVDWAPCADREATGLPEVPLVPVVVQPSEGVPDGVEVGGLVDIEWSADLDLQVTAIVEVGVAVDVPGLPSADVELPFVAVHSEVEGGDAEITLEFEVPDLASANASVYYHNGTAWIDLLADADGVVPGSDGVEDLHVLDTGQADGRVWVTVDHTSLFAVAPGQGGAAQVDESPVTPDEDAAEDSGEDTTEAAGDDAATGADGEGEDGPGAFIPSPGLPAAVLAVAAAVLVAVRRRVP